MTDLPSMIQLVQTGGFIGLLIILAFPTLRQKFGFNKEIDPDVLAAALKKVLVEDDNSPILVKGRIQRICDDVNLIKIDINLIKKAVLNNI